MFARHQPRLIQYRWDYGNNALLFMFCCNIASLRLESIHLLIRQNPPTPPCLPGPIHPETLHALRGVAQSRRLEAELKSLCMFLEAQHPPAIESLSACALRLLCRMECPVRRPLRLPKQVRWHQRKRWQAGPAKTPGKHKLKLRF